MTATQIDTASTSGGGPALTIECAKPDCHWSGPVGEAPNHPCPTPAPAATNEEKAAAAAERGAKIPQVGSAFLDPPDATYEGQSDASDSSTSDEGAEPEADDLERAELAEKLTAAGVDFNPDLDLEQLRGLAALTGATTEPEPPPRAWQAVIADELHTQGSVNAYPWLVVHEPTDGGKPRLVGRAKKKAEGTVMAEDEAAKVDGPVTVVKTAEVLHHAQAAVAGKTTEEATDAAPAQEETPAVETAPMAQQAAQAAAPPPGRLFDTAPYDDPTLALPQIDGCNIDRIAVAFSGEVMLDRSDIDDVALWRRLKLGQTVELWVEAKGLGYAGKGATNKDGELDVVVAKRTVTVQSIRVMGPEDLKEAALEIASQARDAAEAQDARDRIPANA